jgi:hypothetical protein
VTRIRLRLSAIVLLALFVTMAGCHSSHESEIEQGVAVANQWLEFVDAGKYDEALAISDREIMLSFGGRRRFIRDFFEIKTLFGKEFSRSLKDKAYEKDPEDAAPGEYVRIHYDSSWKLAPKATELMLIKKQDDGTWKVHKYVIRPDR